MMGITANGNVLIGLFDNQFLAVNRTVSDGTVIPNSIITDYHLVERNGLVEFAEN